MEKLLFGVTQFTRGLNFTVRLGDKWKSVDIGQFLEVEGWDGLAEIRKIYVCTMADIPKEVFEKEHDPACHDWDGLLSAMRKAYPDYFTTDKDGEEIENTKVTCLGFWLLRYY